MYTYSCDMKKIFALLLFCIALSGACSDSDTDDVKPGPNPSAKGAVDIDADDDSALSGQAAANTLELKVTSASDWTLTVSDTRAGVEWITPSASGGKAGRQSVRFEVAENTTRIDRTAFIRLSNREKTVVVTYTQPHYGPANLTLSVSEITVGHEAVSKTLTLKSELAWSLTSGNESFCTVSPVRGSAGEYTVKVAITENTSQSAKRETTLTARSGYETAAIRIAQDRKKPELNIDRGIKTLDDLCRFRDAVNDGKDLSEWKYNGEINLLADIDLSYIDNWVPIGMKNMPFEDTFNGNGFEIRNMTCKSSNQYLGFFGYCTGGTIKNLNLARACVLNETGFLYGSNGIVCGCLSDSKSYGGKIVNCTVSGYIHGNGICGYVESANGNVLLIQDCSMDAIATNVAICNLNTENGTAQISIAACRFGGAAKALYETPMDADSGSSSYDGCAESKARKYFSDFVDDGFITPENILKNVEKKVYTMTEFSDYIHRQDSVFIDYVNEKFLHLASHIRVLAGKCHPWVLPNIQLGKGKLPMPNLEKLDITIDNAFYNKSFKNLEITDLPNLKELTLKCGQNFNTYSYGINAAFIDDCAHLEKVYIHGVKDFGFSLRPEKYDQLKQLTIEYTGASASNQYMGNSLEFWIRNLPKLELLSVKALYTNPLEYSYKGQQTLKLLSLNGLDELYSLDLSECTELTHLDCKLNAISSLDISNLNLPYKEGVFLCSPQLDAWRGQERTITIHMTEQQRKNGWINYWVKDQSGSWEVTTE